MGNTALCCDASPVDSEPAEFELVAKDPWRASIDSSRGARQQVPCPRPKQRSRRKRGSSKRTVPAQDVAFRGVLEPPQQQTLAVGHYPRGWGEPLLSKIPFPVPLLLFPEQPAGAYGAQVAEQWASERPHWQQRPARQQQQALEGLRPPVVRSRRTPQTADGKVDFSGEWLCSAFEGDVEEFMVALDLSWAARSAAYLINYGVGFAFRRIRQNGDAMEFEVRSGPAEFVQTFVVGSGPQQTAGPDGDCLVDPVWETLDVLGFEQTNVDGSCPVMVRQYFLEEDLVVHMTTPGGAWTAWIFQRQ